MNQIPLSKVLALLTAIDRVVKLGNWPERARARAVESLAGRIPVEGGTSSGFDAGLACCLDLIPRDKQKLAATLHANYSEAAVEQVRREAAEMDPDSETTWWLAASHVCKEETKIDEADFLKQIRDFEMFARTPDARVSAARMAFESLSNGFELRDGVPYATRNGGMQGAYLAGYKVAVEWSDNCGIYFVGTFRPSLGLESFAFSNEVDEGGRKKSGLISSSFAKCTKDELPAVLAVVRAHLGC